MSSEIIMFPGQGSQHLGMGQAALERHPDLVDRASEILGEPFAELCLADPGGRLDQTAYTQPAIYFVSCLTYLDLVEDEGEDRVRCVLGHSAGLFAALFATGVLDLFDGLQIIAHRGALMQAVTGGGMLAVVGPGVAGIEDVLADLDEFDVDVANYNSPDQVVLSGPRDRLDNLAPRLNDLGLRCVALPVSGAFHSRQMDPCRRDFARFLVDFLSEHEFRPPRRAVVSTTTAQVLDAGRVLEEMVFQLVRPVRWWQTVTYLARTVEGDFREVGPGEVLTNLNARFLDTATLRDYRETGAL